jgi:tRNA G18 (ribose-2'-O)-methylase SpoU
MERISPVSRYFINHLEQLQTEDTRNIADKYRWWNHSDIVADLDENRSELLTVFMNVAGDFNISSGIRNNLWFNTSGAYICGKRHYDRRGTVGSHHYVPVTHDESIEDLIQTLKEDGYRIVAAEITDNAVPLTTYNWDARSAVIFGEESRGLDDVTLALADDIVYVPGRGSVRSLNVATTSGIFIYDYSMKTGTI